MGHPEIVIKGVFDINQKRAETVGKYYGIHVYQSLEELLGDPSVDAVINLTSISSHFKVSLQALNASKHVYSEKPLTKSVDESRELFEAAARQGVRLYGAPCNVFSDTIRTMLRAVERNKIGKPLLVYAELDDNPIHLMAFEHVTSPSGAPWPLVEEIKEGCTFEHVGYHLVWICALLGPAVSVTAYSNELIERKAPNVTSKVGTPDFSVACLTFANGASARVTCSVVAPRDHRMRVIGESGEISSDSYRQFQSPVFLEQFSKRSLVARKFSTVRASSFLRRLLGIGGQKIELVKHWKSDAIHARNPMKDTLRYRLFEGIRRREVYAQDKLLGIAEMAKDIAGGRQQFLTPDFLLHVNELTLLIQGAGPKGLACEPSTTFEPLGPLPETS